MMGRSPYDLTSLYAFSAIALMGMLAACDNSPITGEGSPSGAATSGGQGTGATSSVTVNAGCGGATVCADGEVCVNGTCESTDGEFNCTTSGCPESYTCMPTGLCQADVECIDASDCCAERGASCLLQCVDFQCVGNQCNTGESTECYDGCHRGERLCVSGIWAACDAAPVTETEICDDGIDNDCDGTTDLPCPDCTPGYVRPCETACGEGFQTCENDSEWGECDAPTECLCAPGTVATEPCGDKCGFAEVSCLGNGVWGEAGECTSEGVCAQGETEEQDCGSCGVQTRSCDDACAWGEWSECLAGGSCTPGDEEQQSCGACGSQTRVCGDGCGWSEWSECLEGTGCQLGDTQEQSCGFCGVKTKSCLTACGSWPEDWGPCMNEGVCEPGAIESEACGMCGTRQRTCGSNCTWSGWSSCQSQGVCNPGDEDTQSCGPLSEIGICDQGSQYRSCSATCQWNPWNPCAGATYAQSEICANGIDEDCDGEDLSYPDMYESNNSCATCTLLNDSAQTDLEDKVIFGGFHGPNDLDDYYCFYGKDNSQGIFFWTSEKIKISLIDQPLGVDGDLSLYKGQSACETNDYIAWSPVVGPGDEELEWEETGENDDDLYIVRVNNWGEPSCYGEYELRINGLK